MGQILSLKYDFSFKYLFLNEEIRRHFISDVLGIPLEEIRSVRLTNTFLRKRYRKQKQAQKHRYLRSDQRGQSDESWQNVTGAARGTVKRNS